MSPQTGCEFEGYSDVFIFKNSLGVLGMELCLINVCWLSEFVYSKKPSAVGIVMLLTYIRTTEA